MPKRSDPTNNAEIVRNVLAPKGFGRRRSERDPCGFSAAC